MSKTKHMLARSDCSSLLPIALKPKPESFQEITKQMPSNWKLCRMKHTSWTEVAICDLYAALLVLQK
jgi:hypothetical protein